MTDTDGGFPTIIGPDACFKGELSFEKSVRIDGSFEGKISSKGTLKIAEGSKVVADIEAANVCLEGECKGNVIVTEKLQLMATARLEGDLSATRLEIADGAIFIGNVTVGQPAGGAARRSPSTTIEAPSHGSGRGASRSPQQASAPRTPEASAAS